MAYQYILYGVEKRIATITLNRPEKLNAVHDAMRAEISAAYAEAAKDDAVKVVVLKGAGTCFSAGHDLQAVGRPYGFNDGRTEEERSRRPSQRVRLRRDRWIAEIWRDILVHPKITIAQIHGFCLGGSSLMQLCCDVAVAAEDATLGHPEYRLVGPKVSLLQMYILGLRRANFVCYTGRKFTGREAERLGLVSLAVPREKLEEEVQTMAKSFAQFPADGIAIGKAITHQALEAMGVTKAFSQWYMGHTLGTNIQFESDDHNFFRERRERGTKTAFHERDARFEKPGKPKS